MTNDNDLDAVTNNALGNTPSILSLFAIETVYCVPKSLWFVTLCLFLGSSMIKVSRIQ